MSTICDDLRAAILQAAMQGKLTEQVAEDGDASDLLQKIDTINLKKNNKKQKAIKPITDGETPFDIPSNWEWVRLDRISNLLGGNAFKGNELLKEQKSNYVRVIRISDFNQNGIIEKAPVFTRDSEKYNSYVINKNDILMCMTGGTVGKCCIVKELNEKYLLNQRVADIRVENDLEKKYIYSCLISPLIQQLINESKNSTNDNISSELIRNFLIPIPPLAEQKRIVEKVDELMARVTDLEQSADALTSLKKAFPDDIKASLLQAAMQGKLTKQLPEDGSAEDLLEEIKAEKEKLFSEGKIKKQKPLTPITDDEIPFSIPENWKWVRLNDILDVRDGTHDSPKYVKADVGVPLVTSKNLRNGSIDYSDVKYISIADSEAINQRSKVDINDILMAMIGTIGNPVKVVEEPHYSIKNMALLKHLPENMPNMDYILQVLNWAVSDMKKKSSGGVQKFVSLNFIREYPMPLPPLAEQKRIVECLENLTDNINTVKVLIESE